MKLVLPLVALALFLAQFGAALPVAQEGRGSQLSLRGQEMITSDATGALLLERQIDADDSSQPGVEARAWGVGRLFGKKGSGSGSRVTPVAGRPGPMDYPMYTGPNYGRVNDGFQGIGRTGILRPGGEHAGPQRIPQQSPVRTSGSTSQPLRQQSAPVSPVQPLRQPPQSASAPASPKGPWRQTFP